MHLPSVYFPENARGTGSAASAVYHLIDIHLEWNAIPNSSSSLNNWRARVSSMDWSSAKKHGIFTRALKTSTVNYFASERPSRKLHVWLRDRRQSSPLFFPFAFKYDFWRLWTAHTWLLHYESTHNLCTLISFACMCFASRNIINLRWHICIVKTSFDLFMVFRVKVHDSQEHGETDKIMFSPFCHV